MAVNQTAYSGDVNTSAIFLDPPEELVGKINVSPEMNDVLALATMYMGGQPCSEDPELLKKVRDKLMEAKPKWQSMDYGMTEKMSSNDVMATIYRLLGIKSTTQILDALGRPHEVVPQGRVVHEIMS